MLNPGYGDRRNYMEALLCDAAVCFVGENGTKSEIAFCLAAGRPVVLVDYPPGKACPVENDETLAHLVTDAQKRVVLPTSTDSPIDRCIAEAYDRIGTNLPSHEHASSRDSAPAARIVKLALDLAGVPPFPGDFPDWPTDVDVRNQYHRWLAALFP